MMVAAEGAGAIRLGDLRLTPSWEEAGFGNVDALAHAHIPIATIRSG